MQMCNRNHLICLNIFPVESWNFYMACVYLYWPVLHFKDIRHCFSINTTKQLNAFCVSFSVVIMLQICNPVVTNIILLTKEMNKEKKNLTFLYFLHFCDIIWRQPSQNRNPTSEKLDHGSLGQGPKLQIFVGPRSLC